MTRLTVLALVAVAALGAWIAVGITAADAGDPTKPWHTADGFQNLPGAFNRDVPWTAYLRFSMARFGADEVPVLPPGHVLPEPQALADLAAMNGADSLTWLGHATFLIRLDGVTILTDPFLTDRASPFDFGGPTRYAPPGITIENLPPIDVIVLSHSHYDSLDIPTLEAMANKQDIQAVVPLGLGDIFRDLGFGVVHELDWFEAAEVDGLEITALPSQHWSRRTLFDQNKTLWMGAAIQSTELSLYFSGDSGYGPNFADLGGQFGPFDFGIIGIGAYAPREMMKATHTNPEEAVALAVDMAVRTVVGMHWGTIALGTEAPFEAPDRFLKAAQTLGFSPENAWILAIGESRRIR
ncbi:MAG: hydrolase [Alphaproteobacteria bacterium]|nr:hydrolase [Alphaproteobacteria bacterium]MBT5859542.1 hydrolase [Alphaproteobacteria bacterium]